MTTSRTVSTGGARSDRVPQGSSAPKAAPLLGTAPRRRGPVAIVGGGISGLATAFYLGRGEQPVPVELFEASSRFGGNIRTERVDGFSFDVGPDSFLGTRPEGVGLCRELGLEEELITPKPEGRGVYLARDGRLERMPEGLSLGVPLSLGGLLDCSFLSPAGKLRAMGEPLVPRRRDGVAEESIAGFMRRRLGPEMADRLAAPLLAGVYAGDAGRLSMDAAFPQLVDLERRHGSLLRGMLRGRGWLGVLQPPKTPESPFITPREGLERLVRRLVEVLPAEALHTDTRVEAIERTATGYVLKTSAGERECSAVVLAAPPWSVAELVTRGSAEGAFHELGADLREIRWSATATVFFGLDAASVELPLDASGFIVPEGEGRILAATWITSKWSDRAPAGKALVRAFVGGARHPELVELGDEALSRLAWEELRRFMGPLGEPLWGRVYRYRRGNPQPELGHVGRLARLRAILEGLPGLFLTGSGYGGVGIPDCVRQARAAAQLLLEAPSAGAARPSSGVV